MQFRLFLPVVGGGFDRSIDAGRTKVKGGTEWKPMEQIIAAKKND